MARTRREVILDTATDLGANFLIYERKDDKDLPRGEIEAAIVAGEVCFQDIIKAFMQACFEQGDWPEGFVFNPPRG